MEIAIISDTHMPRGARRLPEACVERLRAAELIVHAGDLSGSRCCDELQAYRPVVAVHGNVDDAGVRAALPETAEVEAAGARIAVIHDAGPAAGASERLRGARFPGGRRGRLRPLAHPAARAAPDGFQIFNPGSPTERRRAPRHTMGMARMPRAGQLRAVELD